MGFDALALFVTKSRAFEQFPYSRACPLEELLLSVYTDDPEEGNTAWAKLMLVILSSVTPDSSLDEIWRGVANTRPTAGLLSQALDRSLQAAKDAYPPSWAETDRLVDMCRRESEAFPESIVLSNFRDFVEGYRDVSREVQEQLLDSDFAVRLKAWECSSGARAGRSPQFHSPRHFATGRRSCPWSTWRANRATFLNDP